MPDGQFLPPMALNCVETEFKKRIEQEFPTRRVTVGRCAHLTEPTAEHIALGRGPCQLRSTCERGCGYGAYFSSLSATLPAAQKTGNLTVVTDAIVERLDYDHAKRRISGVRIIDTNTRQGRSYQARVVFVCASTIGTAQILLASQSEYFPQGLANRSGCGGPLPHGPRHGYRCEGHVPGISRPLLLRSAPNGFLRAALHQSQGTADVDFMRGYGFQGYSARGSWDRARHEVGVGAELKQRLRNPGRWEMQLVGYGEMLPSADNRVTLHESRKDRWGLPLVHIDCTHGENERRLAERANRDAVQMLVTAGFENIAPWGGKAARPFDTRNGHGPDGSRSCDLCAEWPQPGPRPAQSVHHRRFLHGIHRHRESITHVYGPVGARRELRRGPAGLGRDLTLVRRAAAGPHTHDELAKSRGHGPQLGFGLGQGEPHAGGPGRGFRHDRNPPTVEGAAIYLIREVRAQRLHYCDLPLGRLRARKGHAARELTGAPRLSLRPYGALSRDGRFACFG